MSWGGIAILMVYLVNIFHSSKSSIDPQLAPVFVGIVRVISSCFSSFIMRWAPRKILFMICMLIVMLGNLTIATFAMLKSQQEEAGAEEDSYLVCSKTQKAKNNINL